MTQRVVDALASTVTPGRCSREAPAGLQLTLFQELEADD